MWKRRLITVTKFNVTGIIDEATGKENSKWMCSIDVSAIDSSGSMEVSW